MENLFAYESKSAKLVSGIDVWISDFVDGVDYNTVYEKYTTVFSVSESEESMVYSDYSNSYRGSSDDFVAVKSISLANPVVINRVSNQLRSYSSSSSYNNPVNAKVEFFYSDGTEANSTQSSTSDPHYNFQDINYTNPNPTKEVAAFKLWIDRVDTYRSYWQNIWACLHNGRY